jgi:hypothetical protein
MSISTISPILVALARVLLIGGVVSLGFLVLSLLESERAKKLAELISRPRR